MKIVPYLACDVLCLLAYLALAFVASRDRLALPMAYAAFCAALCGIALIGAARPEFAALFGDILTPAAVTASIAFAWLSAVRWRTGASAEETLLAAALIAGVGVSLLAGMLERPSYGRLAVQTAAVVLPIAIAIATVGARPLPEPIAQPIYATSPFSGARLPEGAQ